MNFSFSLLHINVLLSEDVDQVEGTKHTCNISLTHELKF